MPNILLNSVPKSGTHLLVQMIEGIPSLLVNPTAIYTEEQLKGRLPLSHNELLVGHVPFTASCAQTLQNHSLYHIFIYRDLRDVAISFVHFIQQKFQEHPLYFLFQNRGLTFEQQLDVVILGTEFTETERNNAWGLTRYYGIANEFENIYSWRTNPSTCSIRYEDLISDESSQQQQIWKMLDYLWDDLKHFGYSKELLAMKMKQSIQPATSPTFRKGIIGGWRKEFTEENKKNFKRMAGRLLIELGYEASESW